MRNVSIKQLSDVLSNIVSNMSDDELRRTKKREDSYNSSNKTDGNWVPVSMYDTIVKNEFKKRGL